MWTQRTWQISAGALGSIVLAAILASCGGSPARTAEATHEAWIEALRSGSYQDAVDLHAYPDKTLVGATVTQYLDTLANEQQSTTERTGGNLSQIEIVGVQDRGSEKQGVSLWTYAKKQICHTTGLVETDQGWKVNAWNETTEPCTVASAP